MTNFRKGDLLTFFYGGKKITGIFQEYEYKRGEPSRIRFYRITLNDEVEKRISVHSIPYMKFLMMVRDKNEIRLSPRAIKYLEQYEQHNQSINHQ